MGYSTRLEFFEPKVEWFKGGKLNITENCIDRHLAELGEEAAFFGSLTIQKIEYFLCRGFGTGLTQLNEVVRFFKSSID